MPVIDQTGRMSGTKIRIRRMALSWSTADLARETGIPVDTIRGYERGHRCPSLERAGILATALRCSIEDLLWS